MNRQRAVLLGGSGLLVLFVLAGYLYKSQRAAEIESMAQANASPLTRDYSPSKGPADAKVTLVEFFDPACETCRIFSPHVETLLASHPGKLRLVLRYAPLHHGSDTMVKILEASRRQGKFWETLQVMFDTQPHWASHHNPQPDRIWQYLPSAGLDLEKIHRDMEDPALLKIINQDIADGKALGARKTPAFFVNGKPLQRFGLAQLRALVKAEIAANY